MSSVNRSVNQWIKRHNILSKDNYKKFYYRKDNKKYLVRNYKDLVRYSGGKHLELDCINLNSSTNREVVHFKDGEILQLEPLGEIEQISGKDYFVINWSDDYKEEIAEVGDLLEI